MEGHKKAKGRSTRGWNKWKQVWEPQERKVYGFMLPTMISNAAEDSEDPTIASAVFSQGEYTVIILIISTKKPQRIIEGKRKFYQFK